MDELDRDVLRVGAGAADPEDDELAALVESQGHGMSGARDLGRVVDQGARGSYPPLEGGQDWVG